MAVLLILSTGLVYLPSLTGGYVYDDHRFVRLNPAVNASAGLASYFTDPATQTADSSYGGLYRPIRTLSFRVVRRFFEGAPGQRIFSLLLHLANGFLLFLLLRQFLGRETGWPPILGALAFLLHPLATESVAWISSRGDLLAMTGILGGLLFHGSSRRGARLLSLLCFALGLLSKESAVVLPLLLVVVDGFSGGRALVRRRLVSYLPYLILLGLYVGLRLAVLDTGRFGQGEGLGLSGEGLLASMLAGEAYYVLATLFPWWLTFELDLAAGAAAATVGFFLVFTLLGLALLLRNSLRPVTLAILWFLAALLPVTVLQFVFPLKIEVANRFAYPALAAFSIVLAFASNGRRPAFALSVLVVASFIPMSVTRAGVWHDEGSLWRDVLKAQPENGRALYGQGVFELEGGDPGAARHHLLRAAGRYPGDPKLATYLGRACRELASREVPGSPEFLRYLTESRSAYQAAVVSWARGATADRAMFRAAALEASWLSFLAGDPDLAARNAKIMIKADGALAPSARTVRHLRELAGFLTQMRYPELAFALEWKADELQDRGSR